MEFAISHPYEDPRILFVAPVRKFSRGPLESPEQIALVRLLRRNKIAHFAVPNGHERDDHIAKILKAEGVNAGAPDLMLWEQEGVESALGLWGGLEMKRITGTPGDARSEQTAWLSRIINCGGFGLVAAGERAAVYGLKHLGYHL